jgi:uncharacterized membrane protein YdjX (TVP38/TMEM64 family)
VKECQGVEGSDDERLKKICGLSEKRSSHNMWRPIILFGVIILLFVVSRSLNFEGKILEMRDWIHSLGILGPFLFTVVYITATITAVPGTIMTIAAGSVFGSLVS